jgi:hypothetical protein
MIDEDRKRIPPLPRIPDLIRMRVIRHGLQTVIEVPKSQSAKPVPFCPVLTFDMMHGASIYHGLNPEDQ